MNNNNQTNKLEKLIQRAISRERPNFNFEKWKLQHQKEVQAYKSDSPERAGLKQKYLLINKQIENYLGRLSAAAIIVLGLICLLWYFGGSNIESVLWADLQRNWRSVENVHILIYGPDPNGKKQMLGQMWLKKPNYYRIESSFENIVAVSDGHNELYMNPTYKRYHFLKPTQKSFTQGFLLLIHYLSGDTQAAAKIPPGFTDLPELGSKLPESTSDTLVYSVKQPHTVQKIWIDSRKMLVKKILVIDNQTARDRAKGIKTEKPKMWMLAVIEYKAVSDDKFTMRPPEDYNEWSLTFSGKVIDPNDEPVAGATVRAGYAGGIVIPGYPAVTDTNGQWKIKIYPQMDAKAAEPFINAPVLFWAYKKECTNITAWTLIENPTEERKPAGKIPGWVNEVEFIYGCGITKAMGIVLQTEPAAKINGLVTDAKGNPVNGAKVSIREWTFTDTEGFNLYPWLQFYQGANPIETDDNGSFTMGNLPFLWNKCYVGLKAEKDGYYGCLENLNYNEDGKMDANEINLVLKKTDKTAAKIIN